MRPDDLKDGSLKALLILALLLANLTVARLRHPERSEAQSKDPVAQLAVPSAKNTATKDVASLGSETFPENRRDPSAALGMTHTP